MKEIEKKVYELIGRTSKKQLCKELNITLPTLELRIENGRWKKTEIEIIERLTE